MTEKTITGWLVVDWKREKHKTLKNKPTAGDLGKNELLAKLQVNVTVPEVDVTTLAVDIDVPEPQVYAATLEALDEADLPDWTDAVHEALESYGFEAAVEQLPDSADIVTTQALLKVNSRPDPAKVREYVYEVIGQLREAETDE